MAVFVLRITSCEFQIHLYTVDLALVLEWAVWTHEFNVVFGAACQMFVIFSYWLEPVEIEADHGIYGITRRLGFIIEYLSHAAVVGFMAGAAITIALQQLRGLFNITSASFSTTSTLQAVLTSVFRHTDEVSKPTLDHIRSYVYCTATKKVC